MEVVHILCVITFLQYVAGQEDKGGGGYDQHNENHHPYWFWQKHPAEFSWIKRCSASLRLTRPRGGNGHIGVVAVLTHQYALGSALMLEEENGNYIGRKPAGKNIWDNGNLIVYHNDFRFNKKHITSIYEFSIKNPDHGYRSPVLDVLYYPDRSPRAGIQNPAKTRDDLALIRFDSSGLDNDPRRVCGCSPAFQAIDHVYAHGYKVHITSFKAYHPIIPATEYSVMYDAIIVNCSLIGARWGHFICIEYVPPKGKPKPPYKTFPYGLESGAAVISRNATLIGIASFSFKMATENELMSYVTSLSFTLYKDWILDVVYNMTAGMNFTQHDTSMMKRNSCHQWDCAGGKFPGLTWKYPENYYG